PVTPTLSLHDALPICADMTGDGAVLVDQRLGGGHDPAHLAVRAHEAQHAAEGTAEVARLRPLLAGEHAVLLVEEPLPVAAEGVRSEEHTSELQSRFDL